MDAVLALASKREVRDYSAEGLSDASVSRILEAGRIAGSSRNRQPWRFYVVGGELQDRLAEQVYAPHNVRGAALVVAITVQGRGPTAFDAGRAAQNMMLAAWNEGIGSCPNGMPDPDATAQLLGAQAEERPVTVISFGYPARAIDPQRRSPEEWIARADRKPAEEVVRRL